MASAVARVSTTDELLDGLPGWVSAPLGCADASVELVVGEHTSDAPELFADLRDYGLRFPERVDDLAAAGVTSVGCFPLRATGGEVIGVFTAYWSTRNTFDADTVDTIATIAEIIALAIERTRATDARDHVSGGVGRLAAVFSSMTTSEAVARSVPELVEHLLGSRLALLSLVDHEAGVLRSPYRAEGIVESPLSSYVDLDLDDPVAPRALVARSGDPILVGDTGEYRDQFPDLVADLEAAGIVAVALMSCRDSSGTVVAVLAAGWPRVTRFDDAMRSLLKAVTDLCGQTIERTRLYDSEHALTEELAASEAHQRETAITLQRALLPGRMPAIESLEIAVRYLSGVEGLEVGGDWYDVIPLPDGRVGLCVGDVVGRGLHAAAAMGQLRSAINALAPHTPEPSLLLDRLDVFADPIKAARYATVAYGILDPVTRQLDYACAGHPPPLVVPPDGPPYFLEQGRSTPLAITTPAGRVSAQASISDGSTLLLYSDGLVERAGEPLQSGLDRLADAVARHRALGLEALCDRILAELRDVSGRTDDVVLLAVTLRGPERPDPGRR